MKHFLKVDRHGYVSGYTFSDLAPDGTWVEVESGASGITTSPTKKRLIDGRLVDTDVPNLPPDPWCMWDEWAGAWVPNVAMAEAAARTKRSSLLQQTDWTQGRDVPDAVAEKWAPYRQALRDVTGQTGFPLHVTWPDPPSN